MEHFRFGPGSLFGRFMTGDDQGELAARFILGKIGTRLPETGPRQISSCSLVSSRATAIWRSPRAELQVGKCVQQAVRRLQEDEGIRQIGYLSQQGFAVGGFAGKVAEI